jgi:hypothetical protein
MVKKSMGRLTLFDVRALMKAFNVVEKVIDEENKLLDEEEKVIINQKKIK